MFFCTFLIINFDFSYLQQKHFIIYKIIIKVFITLINRNNYDKNLEIIEFY